MKQTSGGWGSSLWGGGGTATKEQMEEIQEKQDLLEEELEAKIQENQDVHMQIFTLKDSLVQLQKDHEGEKEEIRKTLADRQSQLELTFAQLTSHKEQLATEQERVEELIAGKKKAEETFTQEKQDLLSQIRKLKEENQEMIVRFKARLPFDPFSQKSLLSLNQGRSDATANKRQTELIQQMAEITSPHKSGGVSQATEYLFQCLKNMFDGSLPVEDMDGNMNSKGRSTKKLAVYLERVLGCTEKLEHATPNIFGSLSNYLNRIHKRETDPTFDSKEKLKANKDNVPLHENFSEFSKLFGDFQNYFCNYLDEQTFAMAKPGSAFQRGDTLGTVNDGFSKASGKVKNLLQDVSGILQDLDVLPFERGSEVAVELASDLCEKILQIKTELVNIIPLLQKKQSIQKEIAHSDQYETKSNNLTALRDEVMQALHSLVGKVDSFQQCLVAGRSAFTAQPFTNEPAQLAFHMPSNNKRIQKGAALLSLVNSRLGAAPAAMPYEQQVAVAAEVTKQKTQLEQASSQLAQARKDKLIFQENAKSAESSQAKLEVKVQILSTKQNQQEQQLIAVNEWLKDTRQAKQACDNSESAASGGFVMVEGDEQASQHHLDRKFGDLEFLLSGEDTRSESSRAQSETKSQIRTTVQTNQQPLKKNKLVDFGHIKDFLSDNQKDLQYFGDVFNGLQKWQLQVTEKNANNKQQQLPLNQFVGASESQKLRLLQQKSVSRMTQMAQKLHSLNKLSTGSSLQVMAKDTEWKTKYEAMEKQASKQVEDIKLENEKLTKDSAFISKNYETQMKMLSEHIVELNQQNERLKSGQSD